MTAKITPKHDLADTFHACVEAIEQGQATIEDCLIRYPDVVGLEELLRTVRAVDRLSALRMPVDQKEAIARQLSQQITQRLATPHLVDRRTVRLPVTFAAAACLLVIFFVGLLYFSQRTQSNNALSPDSTLQPTNSPTSAVISLDALEAKTQECLINPKQFNSFKVKINIKQLGAFINEVKAQTGKKLKAECATQLITMATYLLNQKR